MPNAAEKKETELHKPLTVTQAKKLMSDVDNDKNIDAFLELLPKFYPSKKDAKLTTKLCRPETTKGNFKKADTFFGLDNQKRAWYKADVNEYTDLAFRTFYNLMDINAMVIKHSLVLSQLKDERDINEYTEVIEGSRRSWEVNPNVQQAKNDADAILSLLFEYETYKKGTVKIGKQNVKLFKFLRKLNVFSQSELNSVTTSRTNGDIYICVSRNPVDMLFVATNQSFTSCMDLDSDYSGAYYMGLGTILNDPNRAVVFITNGKTKEYTLQGVKLNHFGMMGRAYVIVGKDDNKPQKLVYVVRSYPATNLNFSDVLRAVGFTTHAPNTDFKSLYKFDIPENIMGDRQYIYVDAPEINYKLSRELIKPDGTVKRQYRWFHTNEGGKSGGCLCSGFNWEGGFNDLEVVTDLYGGVEICQACGKGYTINSMTYYMDCFYCKTCFDERFGRFSGVGSILASAV